MGVGPEIYSGAASFGRVWAIIGAVIGTFFGIIMIVGGIALLAKKKTKE